jgi:probable phosphoglycerate mutase
MNKIYLARHGQDHDNVNGILNGHRDTPLTETGLGQAQVLADTIKSLDLKIDKIFASPLQRAYKTAETVADTLGLDKPEKVDLLIERDFGVMSGKEIKDIAALCAPDIIQSDPITYFLSPEGGETFPMLLDRAAKIIQWLENDVGSQTVLLVSHGDIGKMLYAYFYNLDWKEVLVDFHFGNSEVLLLEKDCPVENRHVHKVVQHNH